MSDIDSAPPARIEKVDRPPALRRINGFGLTIGGVHRDPALAPWYFKQLVFTVLFMPVAFGSIYAVRAAPEEGWYFGGRVGGGEFVRAYGWGGYLRFKLTVVAEVALWGAFLFAFMFLVAYLFSWMHST